MRPDDHLRELAARKDLDHDDEKAIVRAALEMWPTSPFYSWSLLDSFLGIPTRSSFLVAWTRSRIPPSDQGLVALGPAFNWGFWIGGAIGLRIIRRDTWVGGLEEAAMIFLFWALFVKPVSALRSFLLLRGVSRLSFERAFSLAIAPAGRAFDRANDETRAYHALLVHNLRDQILDKHACAPQT
jgi:hypothetical protein